MKALSDLLRRSAVPILSVVTALLFGAVVIVLTDFDHLSKIGSDPLGAIGGAIGGVGRAYGAMLSGAFGDPGRIITAFQTGKAADIAKAIRPITETLVATMPLIFCGLGVAISFRAGMFNIGGDGQLRIGALGATMAAIFLAGKVPSPVILVAAICIGTAAGGFWGFIPGLLKARTGAHEVITTIMLNYVAALVVFFALRDPDLRAAGSTAPVSKSLGPIVDVPNIINLPSIRLDWGFIVALLMAVATSWLLFRTTKGFELRASGFNLTAARYAGMSAGGSMMLAMSLSGALAGMAGAFLVIGTVGQLSLDIAGGIGFNAIALALLAGLRPGGVVIAALLFGALTNGGKLMGVESGIPFDLLFFIMALVIMFVAAPGLIRGMWRIKAGKPAPEISALPSTPKSSTPT
ncbi:MAG: ral nucleoside transport system permease protein [Chloroflexota bacterium]|nr:ral nucleoside transport system permease protein [Chloroflexota bacterium]